MFLRLVYESFRRQKRRKLLAGVAVTLGVAVATAMIAVATDIGDKINRELRTYGANIKVYPEEDTLDVQVGGVDLKPVSQGAYLNESDLPKIKSTFWRHNILGFAPFLPVRVTVNSGGTSLPDVPLLGTYFAKTLRLGDESFTTGVRTTHPWWKVEGAWPADDSDQVLAGQELARRLDLKPGSHLQVGGKTVEITGILSASPAEDQGLVGPLSLAQELAGRPGAVRQVFVSALTKPEDELARRDPAKMTPEVRDRWYCSPYANSIAFQIQEVIPHARAEQIRQVAQTEGAVLAKIKGLMLLITLAALLAAGLAVSAAMATAILERRREVGLMKAMGAGNAAVAALFFAEAGLLALLGGTVGYAAGIVLAQRIALSIFAARITVQPVLFPIVLAVAVAVTFAGSAASIRRAVHFDPAIVLRGEA